LIVPLGEAIFKKQSSDCFYFFIFIKDSVLLSFFSVVK
jgi:hypothetical protein